MVANQKKNHASVRKSLLAAAGVALAIGLTTPAIAPAHGSEAPQARVDAPSKTQISRQVSSVKHSSDGMSSQFHLLDKYGRPTKQVQRDVKAFASQPWLPEPVKNTILTALNFYSGNGEGGPELSPLKGGPDVTQFYWPTVSGRCIAERGDSVGSAIAVPGPTKIPAPGAKKGETTFLFTALGTDAAAKRQGKMFVHWVNLNNLRTGATPLSNNGINEDGPATVSGTAKTGKGTVIAVLSGTLKTKSTACNFAPTAAIVEVK